MHCFLLCALLSMFTCWEAIEAFPEASINADVTGPKKRCPGGYTDGARVDLGRYWYECRDGQLIPKGCMTDDGRRIDVWQTYDSNKSYRMQCITDASGFLAFSYKSCVYDGQEHAPSEQWDDGKYWYTCVKNGDYLRTTISGCVDEGRKVKIDEKVAKGSFVYQCKSTANGTCSMCPVGCKKNGREYDIGESFAIGDFWYTCTNTDSSGPISIKAVGCVHDDRRLRDGDRFFKNDVSYECTVRSESTDIRPVGCVQTEETGAQIERRLDCYWTEGQAPYLYEMTCKYDKATNTAVKISRRCLYKADQGTYSIDPGCYQIVEKSAVSCEKTDSKLFNIRIYQIDDIGQLTAKGLRFC